MRFRGVVRQNHRRVLQNTLDQGQHQIAWDGEVTHSVLQLGFSEDVDHQSHALACCSTLSRRNGLSTIDVGSGTDDPQPTKTGDAGNVEVEQVTVPP